MKRVGIYAALGLILGSFVSSTFGPKLIGWWFQPPVNIGIDCSDAIDWAMKRLVITQSICTGIGLVAGAILGLIISRKKKENRANDLVP